MQAVIRQWDGGNPCLIKGGSSPPPPCLCFRVWYWGFLAFYDSGGYVQELGTTLDESRARLEGLRQNNWINNM